MHAESGKRQKSARKADSEAPAKPDRKTPRKADSEAPKRRGREEAAPGAAEITPQLESALSPRSERSRESAGGGADTGMERFRIEVGLEHGVKPGNIVGAIANEAEIESEYIGRIEIFDDYSTVQLPEGMPKEIFKHLKSVWVSGQRLQISRLDGQRQAGPKRSTKPRAKPAGKKAPARRKPK